MVERVPALRLAAVAVLTRVGDDATSAVVLALLGALYARVVGIAVEARIGLGPDAHNVADLDVSLRLGANPDGDADDFMPDDDWVRDIALLLSVRGSCQGIPFSSVLGLTQPDRKVCTSEPQTPECVILISTSVSSHTFGTNCFQTILPSAEDLSSPTHPSYMSSVAIVSRLLTSGLSRYRCCAASERLRPAESSIESGRFL